MDFTRFAKLLESSNMEHKEHQSEGVKWCLSRESVTENNSSRVLGGIMADDMGLGKTIQMLGVVVCNFKKHTLIVLPKALLNQWMKSINEIYKHEPLLYHGQRIKTFTEEQITKAPIVITTYGMLNKLHNIKWDRVIFDEAHHLRNKETRIQEGALQLKAKNKECIMWFVTGTPIQNRITDLHSLYKILGINKSEYTDPRKHIDLIKMYIIKRNKKDIKLNIPKINENNIVIDWTNEEERDVAEELHTLSVTQSKNISIEKSKFINPYKKPMLPFTMFARQLCVCPKAFEPHLTKLLKEEKHYQQDNISEMLVNTGNSKMDTVIKTVLERKNNRKKLIFCQFKSEINMINRILSKHGFIVDTIDGSTQSKARKQILECQSQDPNYTLVLQIQVGCEGLNLQTFSEVYFVSPNWNPAIEDQAIARCHRIGQKKEVDIFRFYMKDFDRASASLDTYIKMKQDEKRIIMI